ncbi:MAG TPA: hypothetical protein VMX12_05600 [Acidimicrobiia bacterium]|nr:hypothetical protein [Acidimicrobiia bacterium]
MRLATLVTIVALVGVSAALLVFLVQPGGGRHPLDDSDVPVSELYTDTHGHWMQYYWDRGNLRWMVVGRNVRTPVVPDASDTRRPAEIYAKLRMPDRDYGLSGMRNFYVLSPKGMKPCPQLILKTDFVKLLNRLRADRDRQGDGFDIVATMTDFFAADYEVSDLLRELAAE